MKKYAFYSPLSSEDFLEELYQQAKTETEELNQWHGEDIEKGQWKAAWKFEWDGENITLNCTRSERIEQHGAETSVSLRGLSFFLGGRKSWNTCWGEPFRGKIESFEDGGSVLQGRFHMLSGNILLLILLLVGVLLYFINCWDSTMSRIMGMMAGMTIMAHFIRAVKKTGDNPLSKETLEFLKRNSSRWEVCDIISRSMGKR